MAKHQAPQPTNPHHGRGKGAPVPTKVPEGHSSKQYGPHKSAGKKGC